MMGNVQYKQFSQLSFADIEVYGNLPEHPIWSRVAEVIDFSFADDICTHLYTGRGQYPYAPSLKLKLHLVQRYYSLSDREMEERVLGDLFIKRFLGLPVSFMGLDHSTLGLDRNRLGADLFEACHRHILAQAKKRGLWGDQQDVWIVDAFHTHGPVARRNSYRLIKQGVLRVLHPLKRAYPALYEKAVRECNLSALQVSFPYAGSDDEKALVFSNLVVQAFGLLYWFESAEVRPLFWAWLQADRRLASLESQAWLYLILTQCAHGVDPNDPNPFYKKRSSKSQTDRIISAVDPSIRAGYKSKSLKFTGDKIQVILSSQTNLVLHAEPIPGNEDDGSRLTELVNHTIEAYGVRPDAVVGDTAYGTGKNLYEFSKMKLKLSAPVWSQVGASQNGLWSSKKFTYDATAKTVTCPQEQTTSRTFYNQQSETTVYTFPAKVCAACSSRSLCTAAEKAGRSVSISDYYELHHASDTFNHTEEGKRLQRIRWKVERTNNELKNHQRLGWSRLLTREKRRIDVMLGCMVVNMKVLLKRVGHLTLSFDRKKNRPPQRGKSALLAS